MKARSRTKSPASVCGGPNVTLPSGRTATFMKKFTGCGTRGQLAPSARSAVVEVLGARGVAGDVILGVAGRIARREEHVVHARRAVLLELQHRAPQAREERLADLRKEPVDLDPGMGRGEILGGIRRRQREEVRAAAPLHVDDLDVLPRRHAEPRAGPGGDADLPVDLQALGASRMAHDALRAWPGFRAPAACRRAPGPGPAPPGPGTRKAGPARRSPARRGTRRAARSRALG